MARLFAPVRRVNGIRRRDQEPLFFLGMIQRSEGDVILAPTPVSPDEIDELLSVWEKLWPAVGILTPSGVQSRQLHGTSSCGRDPQQGTVIHRIEHDGPCGIPCASSTGIRITDYRGQAACDINALKLACCEKPN